jgi:protoporphyrinogen/coproporphyrinogen III oxidase
VRIVVVGGGIAGLAAARNLELLLPDAEVVLLERSGRLGGKLLTERLDGFLVEGAPDSFLSRKPRGIGLCQELGLGAELVGRRPENARSFVRRGGDLHALPEGLTGLIPTNLQALESTALLSPAGRQRLAAERELPPAPPGDDESVASFVSRRLGREAYEALVEPLLTGIFGGDGDRLSLEATFPQLRVLELEYGSLLRGLEAQSPPQSPHPPFLALRSGMQTLTNRLAESLERTHVRLNTGLAALSHRQGRGYVLNRELEADAVVLATAAYEASASLAALDRELAELLAEIPYASSAIVTLAHGRDDVPHPLDGYGYLVPATEQSDVLACTWSSSKWEGRAPEGYRLIRVYLRRIPQADDETLVELARDELHVLGVRADPALNTVHRWPLGMPQYVLGHPERVEQIEALVRALPGLALAGAAYRGVGIPDCIASGEQAAESIARSLAGVSA